MASGPIFGTRFVHKAIRKETQELEAMARTLDAGGVDALAERFARAVSFFHAHTAGEEGALFPALDERAPGHGAHYEADHVVENALLDDVGALIESARTDLDAARPELQRKLVALAHHADLHIQKEDEIVLPLVAKHFSPPEQGAIVGGIMKHVPPPVLAAMVPWILNALDLDDKATFVGNLERGMPGPVFDKAKGWIQGGIPASDWAALVQRAPSLSA